MIWCNAVSLWFASVLNVFNMNSIFEQVECSEVLSYSCCTLPVKCTQVLWCGSVSSLGFPFFQDWQFLYRETVDFCFCLTLKSCILFLSKCLVTSLVAQTVKSLPAMQEAWVPSLGWEDPLEEEMVTHSSILAWRIPWTEEPHGLQSMGSWRVRQDWKTNMLSFVLPISAFISSVNNFASLCSIFFMSTKNVYAAYSFPFALIGTFMFNDSVKENIYVLLLTLPIYLGKVRFLGPCPWCAQCKPDCIWFCI